MALRWQAALPALFLSWAAIAGDSVSAPPPLVRFSEPPRRLNDVAFSPAGDRLFVADWLSQAIVVFDLQGRRVRTIKRVGLGLLDFNNPVSLTAWPGGYFLNDGGLHLVWLDASLTPKLGWYLPDRTNKVPDARKVVSDRGPVLEIAVWQAAPLGEKSALVTGDYLDAKGWRNGVARLDEGDPLRLTLLAERPVNNPSYLYEINLRPTLARAGEASYELRFGGSPTIARLAPSPGRIAPPKPFDAPLPSLAGMGGRDRALALFAKLRLLRLPAALQGWRDDLYLTTWTPQPGAGLRWDLWRYAGGSWRGPVRIEAPPQARDLKVVPGPSRWALIFLAAPRDPEHQDVLGFRLIESSVLERSLR